MDVGVWGLFCGTDGRQLVRIGETPCGPVSARKLMRVVPRRLLLDEPRVSTAIHTGVGYADDVVIGEQVYTVVTRPVLSPHCRVPVAVMALVIEQGGVIPPAPVVGGWEWEISWDGTNIPSPHTRTRAYWDRELFELYEVDPSVAQQRQGYWEAGAWTSELLAAADQMRVNVSIRDGIHDGVNGAAGVLRCLTYDVVTGYGTEQPGSKHLRLVGAVAPVSERDPVIFMRGVSYEVPSDFQDITFEGEAAGARVDDVLRGVLELSLDPIAVIDAVTMDVLMSSASWRDAAFGQISHIGQLGDFAPARKDELQRFIDQAAHITTGPLSMRLDLESPAVCPGEVVVTAIGVKSGVNGLYAVIRIDCEV